MPHTIALLFTTYGGMDISLGDELALHEATSRAALAQGAAG